MRRSVFRWSTKSGKVVEMLVGLVDVMAAGSRALDREVTRCLCGDLPARRRAAGLLLGVLVASSVRPELARYRSRLVDVDHELVDAGRASA